jgi:hypothetical protein
METLTVYPPAMVPSQLDSVTWLLRVALGLAMLGLLRVGWAWVKRRPVTWHAVDLASVYVLCLCVIGWQVYQIRVMTDHTNYLTHTYQTSVTTQMTNFSREFEGRLDSLERRVPKRPRENCKWTKKHLPFQERLTIGGGLGAWASDEASCPP